jgi:hypothetical protein
MIYDLRSVAPEILRNVSLGCQHKICRGRDDASTKLATVGFVTLKVALQSWTAEAGLVNCSIIIYTSILHSNS